MAAMAATIGQSVAWRPPDDPLGAFFFILMLTMGADRQAKMTGWYGREGQAGSAPVTLETAQAIPVTGDGRCRYHADY
jgi:hypothetical protein